jgi:hypothetical protein
MYLLTNWSCVQSITTFGLVFGSFGTAFDPRGWGKLGPVAIAIIVGVNIHAGSIVSCAHTLSAPSSSSSLTMSWLTLTSS